MYGRIRLMRAPVNVDHHFLCAKKPSVDFDVFKYDFLKKIF